MSDEHEARFGTWSLARPMLFWAYSGRPNKAVGHGTTARPRAWRILKGRARVIANGSEIRVEDGGWLFLPPAMRFVQDLQSVERLVSIDYDLTWPDGSRVLPTTRTLSSSAGTSPSLAVAATRMAAA